MRGLSVGISPIISIVGLTVSLLFGLSGLLISLDLLRNAPSPPPPLICPTVNLTLDGAARGYYNATELATVTTSLTCTVNQTRLGLQRPASGLTLNGQCVDIPSGIIMLPNINPGNVTCGPPGINVVSIAQLTKEGLGFNGSCLSILTNNSLFGGDVTGTKSNLQLAALGGASSCGGGLLCSVTHDSNGRISSLVSGPAVLLVNATAGGGATGLLSNLSLSIVGTADQLTVIKYANGTVQMGLSQPMCPLCSPIFNSLNLTFTPLGISSGGSGLAAAPTNGQLWIGTGTGFALATISGTPNRIIITPGAGSILLSTPQDLASVSSPTFLSISLSTPLSTLNGGTGVSSAPSNGQVLIGNGGTAYTLTTITGTPDQVIVTLGAGSITLSTPQDIGTSSAVTFAGVTFTPSPLARFAGGTGISAAFTNGQTIIGDSPSSGWTKNTITSSAGMVVTNGAGSIILSIGQAIATSSAVSFVAVTLTAPLSIANGGTGLTTDPAAGQLLIGNGAGYTLNTLTGTANQITVVNGAGTVTLSLATVTTGGIVGGSANYMVISVDNQGRIINQRNDTMYANTEQSITYSGCLSGTLQGGKLSKIVYNAGQGSVVISLQAADTTSSNPANCVINIGTIQAGYLPANKNSFVSNARLNATHSVLSQLQIETDGNVLVSPYFVNGNNMYQSTVGTGYPANLSNQFSFQQLNFNYLTFAP